MRCRHCVPGLCFPAFTRGTRQEEPVENRGTAFEHRAAPCTGLAMGSMVQALSGQRSRPRFPAGPCSSLCFLGRGLRGHCWAHSPPRGWPQPPVCLQVRCPWEREGTSAGSAAGKGCGGDFGTWVHAIAYLGATSLSSQILSSICSCSSLGSRGSCSLWWDMREPQPCPPRPQKTPPAPLTWAPTAPSPWRWSGHRARSAW